MKHRVEDELHHSDLSSVFRLVSRQAGRQAGLDPTRFLNVRGQKQQRHIHSTMRDHAVYCWGREESDRSIKTVRGSFKQTDDDASDAAASASWATDGWIGPLPK